MVPTCFLDNLIWFHCIFFLYFFLTEKLFQRAKKVFDPSDTHTPKKRGRPAGSLNRTTIEKHVLKTEDDPRSRTPSVGREQGGVCSVCHNQIKRGQSDRVVSCRECSSKGLSTLYFSLHLNLIWHSLLTIPKFTKRGRFPVLISPKGFMY